MEPKHADVENEGPYTLGQVDLAEAPTPAAAVDPRRGLSLYGSTVEYGLHTMVWLMLPHGRPVSSRDLAEFQGLSTALMAKILPKLEKAGLVASSGGINGGYRLTRPAEEISVLDVVDAIEGDRRVFDCKEIRRGCVLFGGSPPTWSAGGVCGIHAVMLRAENAMRKELQRTKLVSIAQTLKPPAGFMGDVEQWFGERATAREAARVAAVRGSNASRRAPPV